MKKALIRNLMLTAAAALLLPASAQAAEMIDGDMLKDEYEAIITDYASLHSEDTEFALIDMDGDGIRELILSFTADDGQWQFDLFTSTDGEANWLGSYEKYADMYAAKDGDGLFAVIDKNGKRSVDRLTVEYDGELPSLDIDAYKTSSSTAKEFSEGYLVVFNNASLFLEGGEELSVLVDEEYLLPGSDSRYIDFTDLAGMDADELRIARNEIYARHGRRFKSEELQSYFDAKSWYQGTVEPGDFKEKVFNKYESANISFILKVERGQITGEEEPFDDSWYEEYYNYVLAKAAVSGKTQFEIYSDKKPEIVFSDGPTYTMNLLCDAENSNGSYTYYSEEGPVIVYWPAKDHAIQIIGGRREGYYYPNIGN